MRCPTCRTDLAFAAMFDAAIHCVPACKRILCCCPACGADFGLEVRGNLISIGRVDAGSANAFVPAETDFVTCLQAIWHEADADVCFAERIWSVTAERLDGRDPPPEGPELRHF